MQIKKSASLTQPIVAGILMFAGSFVVSALVSSSFTPVYDGSAASEVNVEILDSLSLAIVESYDASSGTYGNAIDTMSMNVTPSSDGTFITNTAYVVVGSNNETGYTLTFSDADDDTDLVSSDPTITATIPSITSVSNDLTDIELNKWGYAFGDSSILGSVFNPIPTLSTPITLSSTNAEGANTYPFTVATKIDSSIPAGTYEDSLVFSLTANYVPPLVYEFDYTGSEQTFTAPRTGKYQIELWGAGGGEYGGGYGAYTAGEIQLAKSERFFIYIGQTGQGCDPYYTCSGVAYNGGGAGGFFTASVYPVRYRGGGGATDIRTQGGEWDDVFSLKSRIAVAGSGGGTGSAANSFPNAGGLAGYPGTDYNNGGVGTQIAGGAAGGDGATAGGFGYGGNGYVSNPTTAYSNEGTGGGGGYYGGGGGRGGTAAGGANRRGTGGGGSSFISGHAGSVAIESADSLTPRFASDGITRCTDGTTDIVCSYHYSGYIFTNTVMIDGAGYNWTTVKGEQTPMPNPEGGYYALGQGHTGDGYARVTYIRN